MKTINEILADYTAGKEDLETTNAALKEAGATYHLEPGRNELTEWEKQHTSVGYYPEQADGWGYLDTGTGTLDKVRVNAGILENKVNEPLPDGSVNMPAYVTICGKTYAVRYGELVEIQEECEECKVPPLPDKADLRRRTDLAGQTVEQKTKTGTYAVTYDENGYAVSAAKKEVE